MSFAVIFVPIYVIACLYVRWQIIWWLKKTDWGHTHNLKLTAAALLIIDTIPIFGAFLPEGRAQAYCQLIGNVWVGFIAAGALFIILANAVILIGKERITPKLAVIVLACVTALTCAYNAYGYIHAQHIYTHYYKIAIDNNGSELIDEELFDNDRSAFADYDIPKTDGTTRIALLADMHMGVNTQFKTICKMVDVIDQADADCILGAGDYFTSSYSGLFGATRYAELFAGMTDDHDGKVYCAYGNHDVLEPLFCGFCIKKPSEVYRSEGMERFFRACNWKMMKDSHVDIGNLQVYFRKDASKTGDGINDRQSADRLLKDADQSKPIIVVQHEPDNLEELAPVGTDLVLSGHTHDGQIWPGNWFTRMKAENAHGFKNVDGVDSIVSSGVGYFGPPLRVGTHGEVVVIDIIEK